LRALSVPFPSDTAGVCGTPLARKALTLRHCPIPSMTWVRSRARLGRRAGGARVILPRPGMAQLNRHLALSSCRYVCIGPTDTIGSIWPIQPSGDCSIRSS